MADLPPYPDAEDVAAELLADLTPGREVVTTLPADLQDQLPLQQAVRIGGGDDDHTDVARIAVDTYAATEAEALALARLTQQRFKRRRARTSAGMMDRATTEVSPHSATYPNEAVRRATAIYRMSLRRTFI